MPQKLIHASPAGCIHISSHAVPHPVCSHSPSSLAERCEKMCVFSKRPSLPAPAARGGRIHPQISLPFGCCGTEQGDGGTVWHGSMLPELGKASVGSAATLVSEARSLAAGSVLHWHFLLWRGSSSLCNFHFFFSSLEISFVFSSLSILSAPWASSQLRYLDVLLPSPTASLCPGMWGFSLTDRAHSDQVKRDAVRCRVNALPYSGF